MCTKRLTEEETKSLSEASQQPPKNLSGAAADCGKCRRAAVTLLMSDPDAPPLRLARADVPPLIDFTHRRVTVAFVGGQRAAIV